jgi:hypothetical protein
LPSQRGQQRTPRGRPAHGSPPAATARGPGARVRIVVAVAAAVAAARRTRPSTSLSAGTARCHRIRYASDAAGTSWGRRWVTIGSSGRLGAPGARVAWRTLRACTRSPDRSDETVTRRRPDAGAALTAAGGEYRPAHPLVGALNHCRPVRRGDVAKADARCAVRSTSGRRGLPRQAQLQSGAPGVLLAGSASRTSSPATSPGWNFGPRRGRLGRPAHRTILMAIMYTCMVFGLAELSSALPVAGAGYGFARRALGPLGRLRDRRRRSSSSTPSRRRPSSSSSAATSRRSGCSG